MQIMHSPKDGSAEITGVKEAYLLILTIQKAFTRAFYNGLKGTTNEPVIEPEMSNSSLFRLYIYSVGDRPLYVEHAWCGIATFGVILWRINPSPKLCHKDPRFSSSCLVLISILGLGPIRSWNMSTQLVPPDSSLGLIRAISFSNGPFHKPS